MIERFCDAYEFLSSDYDGFRNEVTEFCKDSEWDDSIVSAKIKIHGFDTIEACALASDEGIDECVVFDTGEHSGLYLKYSDKTYMVRDTAVKSLMETAKISGSALNKLSPSDLAKVLNLCLKTAKGNSLFLVRGRKLCACLSDIYEIMPVTELLEITEQQLTARFGNLRFVNGYNNYSITTALWELPDVQDELLDKYDDAVKSHKRSLYGHNFMPAVRFMTSDIGLCAATIIPEFRLKNGAYFRVNNGSKIEHKKRPNNSAMENFEAAAAGIFAKYCDLEKTMAAMANCSVNYPLNALVGMCKKAGIPKKYASEAYEELERFCAGGRSCYMDDIYLSIASCMAAANIPESKKIALEDSAAKILGYKWKDFDVAGVVAW